MKKVLSILLSAILIISTLFTVTAANAPAYVGGTIKAEPGTKITVPVSIENNSGIILINLDIVYDENVLKLVSVKDKKALQGYTGLQPGVEITSPCTLRWEDAVNPDNTYNGEIALLTFEVAKGTAVTSTDIEIRHNDAYNFNLDRIVFENAVYTVEISAGPTPESNKTTTAKDKTNGVAATTDKDSDKDGNKSENTADSGKVNTKKPARVMSGKVKSTKKKQAVVTWKQVESANGYQVAYSTSKKFRKKATKTKFVKKISRVKLTIKKLRSKKKYYVKVRAYKTVNGRKVYGSWSKVMTVKVR